PRGSLRELRVGRPGGVARNEAIAITAGDAVEASGDRRRGEAPVALDYKTLQATAAGPPRRADDFCSECRRPWCAPAPDRRHPEAAFPWRAAFLVAVGLALAITFGLWASRAHQRQVAIGRDLAILSTCVDGDLTASSCSSVEEQTAWTAMERDN